MSGIVNKVKDILHKDSSSTSHSTTHSSTTNPNSNTSSLTSGSTNHGGHNSNVANKLDPRIDSDRDGSKIPGAAGHSGVSHSSGLTSGSTNHGPHNTNTGNKLDPRFDSDRDGSHIPGAAGHSGVSNTHGSNLTGNNHSSGLTGNSNTYGSSNQTTSGPHSNDTFNKLDPRVDSDNSKLHSGNHSGVTGTGHSSGLTGNSNTYGNTTSGPHSSDTANRVDPRVDSDRSGGAFGSSNTTGHSTTHGSGIVGGGSHSHTQGHSATHGSTNNGPHDSNVLNKADPRVDSDLSGSGNRHGANTGGVFGASGSHATSGSGTAQNTSGPHNSDLLNKLDPRVDSDKDGSKTVGGNKTHA